MDLGPPPLECALGPVTHPQQQIQYGSRDRMLLLGFPHSETTLSNLGVFFVSHDLTRGSELPCFVSNPVEMPM